MLGNYPSPPSLHLSTPFQVHYRTLTGNLPNRSILVGGDGSEFARMALRPGVTLVFMFSIFRVLVQLFSARLLFLAKSSCLPLAQFRS
jgi:hypothetical protein